MGATPRAESAPVESGWGKCETVLGERGADGKSIEVGMWWICVKDGVVNHVLASPYEIYDILMEVNHEQKQTRLKLRIGPTGKTGRMRR